MLVIVAPEISKWLSWSRNITLDNQITGTPPSVIYLAAMDVFHKVRILMRMIKK